MKKKREKKSRGVLWRALFVVAILAMLAVLELGKHTILGWILTGAAAVCFALLRGKRLARSGRLARLGAWCGLLLVFAGILWISWPPVRAVPAVAGKTGGVTEVVHL
ncbi:MAG: hypothetical protein IJ048_13805, partial [Clostridia bacterium]|nr:hypothetical protein [Clostridia bacterium]